MKVLTWQSRKQKGITLEELSRKTAISKTTLNNIENETVSPNIDQLEKIAVALNTKITALFASRFK